MFFLISYVGIVGSKLETWKQGQATDLSTRKELIMVELNDKV